MELIEALEQLHIRVRRQGRSDISNTGQKNRSIDNARTSLVGQAQTDLAGLQEPSRWLDNATYHFEDDLHQRQLEDFDSSIETLFSQITDLDQKTQQQTALERQNAISCTKSRNHESYLLRRERFRNTLQGCNSMETSQEEDSDSSSQFSGNIESSTLLTNSAQTNQLTQSTHPLVNHLMETCNLSAITDTVRKISRILAIGNELEAISRINDLDFTTENKDLVGLYGLCNEFRSLCSSVPYLHDLPTILRYNECCRNIVNQLDRAAMNTMTTKAYAIEDDDDGSSSMMLGSDEEDDNDREESVASTTNNWTHNKLYNGLESE